jgi:hypothetical protein
MNSVVFEIGILFVLRKNRDEDVTGTPDYKRKDLKLYFARQLVKSGL